MANATIRKITVREWIDGAAGDNDTFIRTHTGRHKVTGVSWPDTNPWIITGGGLDQSSWCVHDSTPLEVEEGTAEAREGRTA